MMMYLRIKENNEFFKNDHENKQTKIIYYSNYTLKEITL